MTTVLSSIDGHAKVGTSRPTSGSAGAVSCADAGTAMASAATYMSDALRKLRTLTATPLEPVMNEESTQIKVKLRCSMIYHAAGLVASHGPRDNADCVA
jgi:hypothetical protein